MANAREMRLRIRSVGNIAQVTRALEAVSASKVRKAQSSVEASRDYARRVANVLGRISTYSQGSAHPLLVPRDKVENIAILLISSDRGLAGPYNMNVTRAALEFAQEKNKPARWVTLGQKGRDLAYVRGANIVGDFSSFKSSPSFSDVTPIARFLIDDYLDSVVDEVYVAYTDYVNTIRQDTRVVRIMPMITGNPKDDENAQASTDNESDVGYTYEPEPEELLEAILPRFTQMQVYQSVLESLASEHSARMVAMRNATDNANELSAALRLAYNKARQLSITSDLLDIAGGAEALQQAG
ncbi:MAG: ATP synthase F1 subunit gamma [Anaerolineaceae bacterium]|nr:ATP synthase F1 subunit gamma [Anaerolineaceae bacterium]HCU81413.1 ATP synthase F1 subunit gamma [Chloroflexota bacterium]